MKYSLSDYFAGAGLSVCRQLGKKLLSFYLPLLNKKRPGVKFFHKSRLQYVLYSLQPNILYFNYVYPIFSLERKF